LAARIDGDIRIVDVRRAPEWSGGHIPGAELHSLDRLRTSLSELDRGTTLAVHCKGGYRSMIACSLLQANGFERVINVLGGFDAWAGAGLPVAT
jgi:hydroxyacylglutathione hydrolase